LALGFDVCGVALNQQRACALAASAEPDIAVMDVCLEGARKEIELARWLREVCHVRVVFVTADADEAILERIQEQVPGAPVLSRPVSHQRLAEAVAVL
jgi:DNA-binding NarL/FixJ family response regulator